MLDIKYIREHPQEVQKSAADKGVSIDIKNIIKLDKNYRELQLEVQKLREDRNKAAKERNIEKGKAIKAELEGKEAALLHIESKLKIELLKLPNPAKQDVKVGKNESENEVIRKYKEPTKFSFSPKDHLELGQKLDIIDVERAAKVSGTRFAYLKNEGVLLEFALVQLAMQTLIKEGFTPIIPPVLIKKEITQGLGYWQDGGSEDYFQIHEPEGQGFYLVGTAEHSIVPMHANEIFNAKDLPRRYVGFSTAFRREAGSYGKDTKGILRVHQFDKIEMVSFVEKGKDDQEHEFLLSLEEKLFKALEIPYQVIKMCTGDLGFPAARKYDIESWMPGQNKYREVTSVSTVTDFQARRLNIKYRKDATASNAASTEFVNILNGTAFAIGRTIIAILENYQQEDGSVSIPQVLQKYVGKDIIRPHKA
ncbi:serine--tRNA ligase [Patescibacteria group bacterium]|nr:serine--tRNA ligase [Patescibacteria group bacterium]